MRIYLWLVICLAVVASAEAQQKRFVYLTFDDGVENGTKNVLDTLGAAGVKATLFITGHNTKTNSFGKERLKEADMAGHLLANHSYCHWHEKGYYDAPPSDVQETQRCVVGAARKPSYKTNAQWSEDFADTDALVANYLARPAGSKLEFARMPGANFWRIGDISANDPARTPRAAEQLKGTYKIVGWDLEWIGADSNPPVPSEPVDTIKNAIIAKLGNSNGTKKPNKLVLLMHFRQFAEQANQTKLADLITKLKKPENNIEFRMLNTYLTD